jgi:hypothetical protein
MAYYSPDHDYIEGKKIIESLDPTIEKDRLIQYYVKKQQEHIDQQNKRLEAYQSVFDAIDRFLPNHNPVLR